jgi:hypothetical protein
MVDEVEIKNVGGKFGVASEATLSALVDTLSRSRNGTDQASRLERIAREANTRTIRDEGAARKGFISGITDSVKGLGYFGKELITGGDRMGDFAEMVLGAGTAMGELIRYTEGLTDAFRDLSTYGASFNNSLFDMRLAAAESEVAFDDFTSLVRNNSQLFAKLGGTTSEGAKQFGIFSRNLRTSKIGQELMGMGFTINEINSSLATYLDAQLMSGRRIELRDRSLMESSSEYMMQLDKLAKLTGKQREQLAQEMAQLQQDAGLRRQINSLEGENRKNLEGVLTFVRSSMPGLASGFEDIMDGLAQTDLGVLMQTQIKGLGPLMQRAFRGEISEVDFIDQLKQFKPQIDRLQKQFSTEQIAAMRQAGGITAEYATMLDSLFELNKVLEINTEQYKLEADQRSKLTTLFGNFEQTVQSARGRLISAFIKSEAFSSLERLGEKLLTLISDNGSIDGFSSGLDRLFNYFFGKDGTVTKAIDWFTEFLSDPDFEKNMDAFFDTVKRVTNNLIDFFFGKKVTTGGDPDSRTTERVGGLFENIYTTFEQVFNGEKTIFDVIYEGFVSTFNLVKDAITNYIGPVLKDFFYGEVADVGYGENAVDPALAAAAKAAGSELRTGGFLKTIVDGFWSVFDLAKNQLINFWEGPNGTELKNTISGFFENLVDSLILSINKYTAGALFGDEAGAIIEKRINAGLAVTPEQKATLAEERYEADTSELLEATNATVESLLFTSDLLGDTIYGAANLMGIQNDLDADLAGMFNRWTRSGYMPGAEQTETPESPDIPMGDPMGSGFAKGTSGFQNFGDQSVATLHGVEAVVPRNTPAGDFLDRYFTNDWQAKTQPVTQTAGGRSSTDQENLIKYLIQLNSTMVAVLSEIRKTNEIEKQTLNSMRGMGGDLFRSV